MTDVSAAQVGPSPLAQLQIAPAVATLALNAVGIYPHGTLGAALVHAATDILLAVTIARCLPDGGNFEATLQAFPTISTPQPLLVLHVQSKLLMEIENMPLGDVTSGTSPAPGADEVHRRLRRLATLIDGAISSQVEPLEGAYE